MNKTKTLIAALALPAALFAVGAHPAAAATTTPTTTPTTTAPGGASVPAGYVQLVDDTNHITVTVPNTWTTVDTNPSQNPDGTDQPWILATAGTDLDNFQSTFVDGVLYVAFPFEADPHVLMDQYKLTGGCPDINDTTDGVQPYSDGVFTGLIQVGTGCDTSGDVTWNMVVASPPDNSFTAVLQVQTTDPTAAADGARLVQRRRRRQPGHHGSGADHDPRPDARTDHDARDHRPGDHALPVRPRRR